VTRTLYDAGAGRSGELGRHAPSQSRIRPATGRNGGRGMRIDYTIVNSPLGRLLLGATDRGVSALYLGESDKELEDALGKEYARAVVTRQQGGSRNLQNWIKEILAHLRGQESNLDLPIDVRATVFQRRVWEELGRIPCGTTCTYAQIARKIGKPSAVRAVARACATNPVSVVIPCHRVVCQDGALAGYRWGIDRKRALLEQESSMASQKQKVE
jgi:AraC family transcriptional regulator of adaptative response/methylated-DNA-[protein]-cysteine methyltransferase